MTIQRRWLMVLFLTLLPCLILGHVLAQEDDPRFPFGVPSVDNAKVR